MVKKIQIDEALKLEDCIFIDVRSPKEFEEATIPGAVNIPIFDNTEREVIGKIYHNINKQEAIEKGLEIASSKLLKIYKQLKQYSDTHKNVAVFCWRGGMRSKAVTTILDLMKLKNIHCVIGGYKAYRRHVVNFFNNLSMGFRLIVVHGMTGVGKTTVLETLSRKGFPVIDLEALACHRGSVFGGIGIKESRSQKMFEALLMEEIKGINAPLVFVESESPRIGNKILPKQFVQEMRKGIHIKLEAPLEIRVARILKEYVTNNTNFTLKTVKKNLEEIKNRLGKNKYLTLLDLLAEGKYSEVIEVLLKDYYDPRYGHSSKKYNYCSTVDASNIDTAVEQLIKFYNSKKDTLI